MQICSLRCLNTGSLLDDFKQIVTLPRPSIIILIKSGRLARELSGLKVIDRPNMTYHERKASTLQTNKSRGTCSFVSLK